MTRAELRCLSWSGSACGLAGAALIALNLPVSGWGFVLFMGSSLPWLAVGLARRDGALALLNAGFTVVNALGIWRWLA